ncbi:hypothetical protein [Enterococcus faecalis]|uniref:hypothetical protein n=1 Tax=Enterococcus faecalis TaxID=1351 RepID=UPI00387E0552
MNEEKRPKFPDKYHLSRKESVYLLKKNIVELVYNAGKFEGLNTTLLQTEEIIKYNRANNVAVDDVLTVVNLKRGFEMLLNDLQEPLIETSKRINRIVAAEDALFSGEIRTGGVEVSTIQGRYVPPMLTEDEVNNQYGEIMNKEISKPCDCFYSFNAIGAGICNASHSATPFLKSISHVSSFSPFFGRSSRDGGVKSNSLFIILIV